MDTIVLSPHLDDAVFSCAGLMAREAAAGKKVLLATVFTGTPDPAKVPRRLRAFADYEERILEDTRAASLLGAERASLGLIENIFQIEGKPGPQKVFTTPGNISGFRNLSQIRAQIDGWLEAHPEVRIYSPLGIGNHHDHVETFVAAVQVLLSRQCFENLVFYEDIYGINLQVRQQHFVARKRLWKPSESPDRVSLRAHLGFRLMAWMLKGPPVESYFDRSFTELTWNLEEVPIHPFEKTKLEASFSYTSQISLFGGKEIWSKILSQHHRVWGGAEPIWKARPAVAVSDGRSSSPELEILCPLAKQANS